MLVRYGGTVESVFELLGQKASLCEAGAQVRRRGLSRFRRHPKRSLSRDCPNSRSTAFP